MQSHTLIAGKARFVASTRGGGALEYSIEHGGRRRHILRPSSGDFDNALDRAMVVMAPWCNRISGGGFHFNGRFHELAPNFAHVRFPLHGNALQEDWSAVVARSDSVELELVSQGPGSFAYRASIEYALEEHALTTNLRVANTGTEPMPFGIGLHPWFVTTPNTMLSFLSRQVLRSDSCGVPIEAVDLANSPDGDFTRPRHLPRDRIDNSYIGWQGAAHLSDPGFERSLVAESDPLHLHVFSPSADGGFCCLEPQTAVLDAANCRSNPAPVLGPEEQMSIRLRIAARMGG